MPFGGEEDAKRLPVAVGSDLVDLAPEVPSRDEARCATSFIAATTAAASLSERLIDELFESESGLYGNSGLVAGACCGAVGGWAVGGSSSRWLSTIAAAMSASLRPWCWE